MDSIRFWYDASEQKLIVLHNRSGERREIRQLEKIVRFLKEYDLTPDNCKGVQSADDRTHLFAKMRIRSGCCKKDHL
ncbi:hypothetical protein [Thermoactinomyces mirandus]|uniref:Uncharacterized protein n=1 Tax=Thermoactinomyces mirandus TaxID=2756294 RepID=A0A7W1XRB1_9BACL|nr:hypothetical protein [Thermoactinomyces mirandus]MBA4601863.1 hypothetical protein [Thermoactinomyces mirandus]